MRARLLLDRFLLALMLSAALGGASAEPAPVASVEAAAAPVATAPAPLAAPTVRPAPVQIAPMNTAPGTAVGGPSAGNLLQTILALVLVLGLLAGLAWFMKRFGPRGAAGSAHLRIVGALNLGGRERIMVVEVGDQWIVVGASPGRVNALATMPRQEGSATATTAGATLHPHLPPASSFSEWLKQTIDKRNAK